MRKLIATILVTVLVAGCHPWFESRFPWEEGPDPNQEPVLTTSPGVYFPGDATWVPLIDDCMAAGGSRRHCINALPPAERAKLEDWRRDLRGAQ